MEDKEIKHIFESVYGQNVVLAQEKKKQDLVIRRLKTAMVNTKGSAVSIREVYDLVDRKIEAVDKKIDAVDGKVDGVGNQVANINGRLMIIPFLVSTAIGIFFFIINFFTRK